MVTAARSLAISLSEVGPTDEKFDVDGFLAKLDAPAYSSYDFVGPLEAAAFTEGVVADCEGARASCLRLTEAASIAHGLSAKIYGRIAVLTAAGIQEARRMVKRIPMATVEAAENALGLRGLGGSPSRRRRRLAWVAFLEGESDVDARVSRRIQAWWRGHMVRQASSHFARIQREVEARGPRQQLALRQARVVVDSAMYVAVAPDVHFLFVRLLVT